MGFQELGISSKTVATLQEIGYERPTEVQVKTIPDIIEGNNLIVRSQTGTGKTAAFGIGLIERIVAGKSEKALILAPTRELAVQVCKELRAIGKEHNLRIYVVYGGQSINIQIDSLRGGVDILIATPGRLLDLCRRGIVRIPDFDMLVLDEADHMLDLGFQDEVTEILDKLRQERLTILVSATIDESILRMASKYIPHSKTIEIGEKEIVATIKEEHVEVTEREKFSKLMDILTRHRGIKTLIFRETKKGTMNLQDKLYQRGFRNTGLLQGDMSQARRNAVLSNFKKGSISILVATNVAARGLHIEGLDLIINYDEAQDEETHLHRVGRTGRMGAEGRVINFAMRRESRDERMREDHPDFAWMREGFDSYRQRKSEPPKDRFSQRRRGRGKTMGQRRGFKKRSFK